MLPQKISKTRILGLTKNEFHSYHSMTFPWHLEFSSEFPDFQRSSSNSLTFAGFPCQHPEVCYYQSLPFYVSLDTDLDRVLSKDRT